MFIMTDNDLDYGVPLFTHQYEIPTTILFHQNASPYSSKFNPYAIILKKDKIVQYKNATTQIGNEAQCLSKNLLNVSTVTECNLTNSQIKINDNQQPEIIKINSIENVNVKYSDNDSELCNFEEEEEDNGEEDFAEKNSNNPPFLFNNFVPNNNNGIGNILYQQNQMPQNRIIIPPFRDRFPKKSKIELTPEAKKFRDSFYKCYGDKKRFSKSVVRDIHNSICGALGLPRMSRAEYRSILLYFNNYAQYRHRIIQAINLKKSFFLRPIENKNRLRILPMQ